MKEEATPLLAQVPITALENPGYGFAFRDNFGVSICHPTELPTKVGNLHDPNCSENMLCSCVPKGTIITVLSIGWIFYALLTPHPHGPNQFNPIHLPKKVRYVFRFNSWPIFDDNLTSLHSARPAYCINILGIAYIHYYHRSSHGFVINWHDTLLKGFRFLSISTLRKWSFLTAASAIMHPVNTQCIFCRLDEPTWH